MQLMCVCECIKTLMSGKSSLRLISIQYSKQLTEKMIEMYKSGKKDFQLTRYSKGYLNSSLNNGRICHLLKAGHPCKLSDRARRRLKREATKTPITT